MTPLGCPDCLLIRYEPRALRARLRASMNTRARARHSRARVSRPSLCRSIFFPSLFVEGALFSACLRVHDFVVLFVLFLWRIRDVGAVSRFAQPSEVIARIRGFAGRASNRGYEILDAITISLEYHLLLPRPIIFRMPWNKAPYAAAAVSSLTSAGLLWRVLNLYRIAEYRALLSTVISPGLVIVAILQRSIALS